MVDLEFNIPATPENKAAFEELKKLGDTFPLTVYVGVDSTQPVPVMNISKHPDCPNDDLYEELLKRIIEGIKEDKPSEDLDVEMDKFFETMPVLEHENIFEDTFKNIARHFAQWQKEQLLKGAIECDVLQDEIDGVQLDTVEVCPDGITLENNKFKVGDKVRIIIVKEEQKEG